MPEFVMVTPEMMAAFEEHEQGTMLPETAQWVQPLLTSMLKAMDNDDNDRIFIFMNKSVETIVNSEDVEDRFFRELDSRWREHMIEEVFPRWVGNDFQTDSVEVEGNTPYQRYTVIGSYPPFKESPNYPDGRDYQNV